MPWTVTERPESRGYHFASPLEESSVTLVYKADWTPDPGNPTEPYPGDGSLRVASGLPQVRQRVPSAVYGSDAYLKRFVVRSVDPVPVVSRPYCFEVTVTATTLAQPGEIDFALPTRSAQERIVAAYRFPVSLPTDGIAAWPSSGDIGGTKVDLNGTPRELAVAQKMITVEVLWDRTQAAAAGNPEPPESTWQTFLNTRNDATFLNHPKGTLRYLGWEVAPYLEWYRIQHRFLYDAWYHLEQVPVPKPTGEPICTSGVSVCGVTVLQADKIGWMQRYATLSNYNGILTTGQLSELTTPVPAWI